MDVALWPLVCSVFVGCRPQEPPRFTPSKDVKSLLEFSENADDRKVWEGLQAQIEAELTKRCGTPLAPVVFDKPEADRTQLERGAEVYALRCQPCHGVDGNGLGPVAGYLSPKPRDYTKGIFKFTSTPYGEKPRRSDLLQTIRRGVTGTAMPAFENLSPEDLNAVVDYVILLSQRGELEHELAALAEEEEELDPEFVQESVDSIRQKWAEANSELVMPVTPMPPMTPETIAKGHELYLQQVCNKCHGLDGRGGLAGNIEIGKDAWGHETAAADLTSGMYRGGGRPIDIYRRIYSGINGTPMPGFAQAFSEQPDNIWYLVHFVRDMGERRRRNLPPGIGPVEEPPPASKPAAEPSTPPASPPSGEVSQVDYRGVFARPLQNEH
jgi:mono/diheme cytochrome c family protein